MRHGSVTEFESRNIFFLENEFPSKVEINQNLSFYEIEDQDYSIVQNRLVYLPKNVRRESDPSRSETRVLKSVSRESQIRKSG